MNINQDHITAFLFAAAGLPAVVLGYGYGIGTPSRMGAGFVPTFLGAVLLVLAVILTIRTMRTSDGHVSVTFTELRPLAGVMAGLLLFAALLETAGLIISVAVLVVVVRLSDRRRGWIDLAATALILVALSTTIFVYGLGLAMPLWF